MGLFFARKNTNSSSVDLRYYPNETKTNFESHQIQNLPITPNESNYPRKD